jgi:hypothetical protein
MGCPLEMLDQWRSIHFTHSAQTYPQLLITLSAECRIVVCTQRLVRDRTIASTFDSLRTIGSIYLNGLVQWCTHGLVSHVANIKAYIRNALMDLDVTIPPNEFNERIKHRD